MTIRRIVLALSILAGIFAMAPLAAAAAERSLSSEQIAVAIPGSTIDIFEGREFWEYQPSATRYQFADDGSFTYYRETDEGILFVERDKGTWRTASNRLCLDYDARSQWNDCWVVEQTPTGFAIVGKTGPIKNSREVVNVFKPGFLSTDDLLAAVDAAE